MAGKTVAALTLAAVGVVAGCGTSGGSSTTGAPATASGPMVSFVSPAMGSHVSGAVKAEVVVHNFTISPDHVGQAPIAGEGHLHFSMDGGKYDFPKYSGANGGLAVKLNVDGMYSPSVTPDITYRNLPAGQHTLKVWLADNSHNNTGVSATTTFVVRPAAVSFITPATGSTTKSTVTARVMLGQGFRISAAHVGQAPVAGEGHLHFSMDGGRYDNPKHSGANGELAVKLHVDGRYSPSVMPEITYTHLPPGRHTLVVMLADNSHNPTGDMAATTFTVK